jgi:hypothetical protein
MAGDSSGTSMPDEISGMGKTHRNASLPCKKVDYINQVLFRKYNFEFVVG